MSNPISAKNDQEKTISSLHGTAVFADSDFNRFYDLVYGKQYAQAFSGPEGASDHRFHDGALPAEGRLA
jgi:hypothetical protein